MGYYQTIKYLRVPPEVTVRPEMPLHSWRVQAYKQIENSSNSHSGATKQRDLSAALYLRPRDVWHLYGIASSTICELCQHPDPVKRLPSKKIVGRSGRRGMRLIKRTDIEAWLDRAGV